MPDRRVTPLRAAAGAGALAIVSLVATTGGDSPEAEPVVEEECSEESAFQARRDWQEGRISRRDYERELVCLREKRDGPPR
jgi:hypothetical protein